MSRLLKISGAMNTVSDIAETTGNILNIPGKIAGGIMGIGQGRRAKRLLSEADKLTPPLEDPETRSLMSLIQRKGRAIERGVDPITAYGKKMIRGSLATTQANILRGAKGDPRFLLEGLRKSAIDASGATSKLVASTFPASQYYTNLSMQLQKRISDRKFGIQMSNRLQKLREGMELFKTSRQNIAGAIGTTLPV